ncbi:hypothetical protein CO608_02800 [Lysobacteraceae bacterium NML08-0793]|nr:hypothetical protein CO608_02800 [Xanthomonadaceae bacterium NML08-0793]
MRAVAMWQAGRIVRPVKESGERLMNMGNRRIVAAVLFMVAAFALPQAVMAQSGNEREYVEAADVVMRGGQPYYRHGNFDADDRLYIEYDRSGRSLYYRQGSRHAGRYRDDYRDGYYRSGYGDSYRRCDSRGRCRVEYYDPRYDRRGEYRVYDDYARRYVRGQL